MKVNLKNILGLAALGMTLLTTTVPTWAGWVSTPEVSTWSDANFYYAQGTMVGARYSADSKQFLWCFVVASPNQPSNIQCYARNSAGNDTLCISNDPRHVADLQGMTDSSYIYFSAKRGTAACDRILISNHSNHLK